MKTLKLDENNELKVLLGKLLLTKELDTTYNNSQVQQNECDRQHLNTLMDTWTGDIKASPLIGTNLYNKVMSPMPETAINTLRAQIRKQIELTGYRIEENKINISIENNQLNIKIGTFFRKK